MFFRQQIPQKFEIDNKKASDIKCADKRFAKVCTFVYYPSGGDRGKMSRLKSTIMSLGHRCEKRIFNIQRYGGQTKNETKIYEVFIGHCYVISDYYDIDDVVSHC